MNTRQLEYAIELSKNLNFSTVAERLGISQPALSKQILSLENELGVKLFDRTQNPITITPAGQHFIAEAQNLLYREDQLLRSMEEFKSGKRGCLVIGISPFRSLYLMPNIIKEFKQKYPQVTVVLREAASDILRKEAAEGKYDLAIVNLPVDESVLDTTLIEPDNLVLAVPKNMLNMLPITFKEPLQKINFDDCKDLPFVAVGQTQEMRQLFERLCATANFKPKIAVEVVGVSNAWAMSRAGVGATLLPLQFIENFNSNEGLALFALKNCPYSRQPAIITKKGQYLSEYAKYAIELLTEN